MCWSMEASTALAAIGLGSTAYCAVRGDEKRLWIPLGYFSLMEALQAYSYTVIDQCSLPANQVATLLGALHVIFQTLMVNYFSLYFIPKGIRKQVEPWVYTICAVGIVMLLLSLYPFTWADRCPVGGDTLCGNRLCSISGSWHIAWEVPRSQLGVFLDTYWYAFSVLILPFFYGAWKITLYHLFTGPFLAFISTGTLNEWAAVWCLYSIGLLLLVAKTRLRELLKVQSWYGLPFPEGKKKFHQNHESVN